MSNCPEIPTSLLPFQRVRLTPKCWKLCQINTTQKKLSGNSDKTQIRSSVLQKNLCTTFSFSAMIYRSNHHDAKVYLQIGACRIFTDSLKGTFFIRLHKTQANNSIFYPFWLNMWTVLEWFFSAIIPFLHTAKIRLGFSPLKYFKSCSF